MPYKRRVPDRYLYDFISEFTNVKKVHLTTYQRCGGDPIDTMKRLAKDNTIDMLSISIVVGIPRESNVNFDEIPNHGGSNMMQFTHLKTIEIAIDDFEFCVSFHQGGTRKPLKILSVYSSQILSSVENIKIFSMKYYDWDLTKLAPKLRHLYTKFIYDRNTYKT